MRCSVPALLVALALLPRSAAADELRPLCPDRPGKATPPCIVDAGHLQIETSVIDWSDRAPADDTRTLSVAGFEARLGLTPRTEVELAWTPLSISESGGVRRRGIGDLTLGARTALTSPDAPGLAISLEPFVTAPTGTHGQGAGQWGGGVLLPISLPVSALSIGFTPAVQAQPAADGRGARAEVSAALGASYAVGSLSFGGELWGSSQPAVRGAEQASADLFAAWSPAALRDVQFDAGLYAGLTRNTPRLQLSLGVAHRF